MTREPMTREPKTCRNPLCRSSFVPRFDGQEFCGVRCVSKGTRAEANIEGTRVRGGRTSRYSFTASQDDLLRRRYNGEPERTDELMRHFPGFPRYAVRQRARKLGLAADKAPRWTEADLDWLRAHHLGLSVVALAKHLKRTVTAVRVQLKRLGVRLLDDECYSLAEVALILGQSRDAVQARMLSGMLTHARPRAPGQSHRFTAATIRRFVVMHPDLVDLRRIEGSGHKATFLDILAGGTMGLGESLGSVRDAAGHDDEGMR